MLARNHQGRGGRSTESRSFGRHFGQALISSVHKVLSLDQNVHFQGLRPDTHRDKINVEFTGVNDHLF